MRNPVRLLSVGRLAPNKGLEYSLRAVRLLLDEGFDVNYQLLGRGPCEQQLRELVASIGIEACVRFAGELRSSRVAEMLHDSHILITPSITGPHGEQEGLPNTIKEAMAVGVPTIATNTGGIPELIDHGVTGYLVAERSPQAIANCVTTIVEKWPEQEGLVAAARSKIELEYDLQYVNEVLENIYRERCA